MSFLKFDDNSTYCLRDPCNKGHCSIGWHKWIYILRWIHGRWVQGDDVMKLKFVTTNINLNLKEDSRWVESWIGQCKQTVVIVSRLIVQQDGNAIPLNYIFADISPLIRIVPCLLQVDYVKFIRSQLGWCQQIILIVSRLTVQQYCNSIPLNYIFANSLLLINCKLCVACCRLIILILLLQSTRSWFRQCQETMYAYCQWIESVVAW